MKRIALSIALTFVVAVSAFAVAAPAAAGPEDAPWPLVTTRYDGTIYELVDGTRPVRIDGSRWRDVYGNSAPSESSTEYVKYPWSATIYAVTFWPGGESAWQWKAITAGEWKRAGNPRPRNAGHIEGSTYYRWATSSELFVTGPDRVTHKLTAAEWRAAGNRSFEIRADRGYARLTWASAIATMSSLRSGAGSPISAAQWTAAGNPTPQRVARFVGDQFYQNWGSSDIWYAGPTMNRRVTFAEWRAAGSPTPTIKGRPAAQAPAVTPPTNVSYKNCAAVRAAGKAPIYRGQPGYASHLDRDNDGVGCES